MVFAGSQEYDITLLQCIRMMYGLTVQGGDGYNGDLQLEQHTEHYECDLVPHESRLRRYFKYLMNENGPGSLKVRLVSALNKLSFS